MHPNNLGNGEKEKSPVRCPVQNFSSHNKGKNKAVKQTIVPDVSAAV